MASSMPSSLMLNMYSVDLNFKFITSTIIISKQTNYGVPVTTKLIRKNLENAC